MTIRKTTSTKSVGGLANVSNSSVVISTNVGGMRQLQHHQHRVHPHTSHYAHHNVVIVASPSRRTSLLQRQVTRALEVIDQYDEAVAMEGVEAGDSNSASGEDDVSMVVEKMTGSDPVKKQAAYTSPSMAATKRMAATMPAAAVASLSSSPTAPPTGVLQISPNAVKRKRTTSTGVFSDVAATGTAAGAVGVGVAVAVAVVAPPSVAVVAMASELRVDIEAIDTTTNSNSCTSSSVVVVAKRTPRGAVCVTPSKRCNAKDKKKKQKVDVIDRALKRFRSELHHQQQEEDHHDQQQPTSYEFMTVCHQSDDGRTGLMTPRHDGVDREASFAYSAAMEKNGLGSSGSSASGASGGGAPQLARVQVGVAAAQGARAYMEDRFSVTAQLFEHHEQRDEIQSHASLLAMYDGHNGPQAAEYGATRFRELLADNEFLLDVCKRPTCHVLSDDDIARIESILVDVFELVDDEIVETTISQGKRDGSTVLLGLLISGKLFVANLGDTRGVLASTTGSGASRRRGDADDEEEDGDDGDGDGDDDVVRVSVDHKPDLKTETARIEEAGGKVIFSGCWRVAHDEIPLRLAVSRALGDHPLKTNLPLSCSAPLVSVVPDIQVLDVSGSGDLLVFATDGLWDRLSDDDAIRIARTKIAEFTRSSNSGPAKNAMHSAAIALVETALVKRSMDNITAMVISVSSDAVGRLDEVDAQGSAIVGDADDADL